MNVILFPAPAGPRDSALDLPDAALYCVIASLRALGEPATATEIAAVCEQASPHVSSKDVMALLAAYCDGGVRPDDQPSLFRRVTLRGAEAWALTRAFREILHQRGLTPSLRPDP